MLEFKLINSTAHGKVYMCTKCGTQLALMFGNISISYSEKEFEYFLSQLYKLKREDYFGRYPTESKVHLRTEINNLFFSLTKQEVNEIIDLMANALFKFTMIKGALSHTN